MKIQEYYESTKYIENRIVEYNGNENVKNRI